MSGVMHVIDDSSGTPGVARPLKTSDLGGGGGASTSVDREAVITLYKVITAFTGATVGDKIVHTRWIDVDGTTPTIWAEEWYNDTTRAALASAPLAVNLGDAGGGGTADSTATNQLTQITRETEIRDAILARVDKHGAYKFVQSEEISGTTYILKSDGTGWLMTKIVSTATTDAATYAGVGNNSTITLATAWANKVTLVYGSVAAV